MRQLQAGVRSRARVLVLHVPAAVVVVHVLVVMSLLLSLHTTTASLNPPKATASPAGVVHVVPPPPTPKAPSGSAEPGLFDRMKAKFHSLFNGVAEKVDGTPEYVRRPGTVSL